MGVTVNGGQACVIALFAVRDRMGHLCQGRYEAVFIDADCYMLELVRYIHNNPVRAGMVQKAVDYRWSGHRVCLGRQELPFLSTDLILGQFSPELAGTAPHLKILA
jgi:hypothetical protein